MQEMEFEAVVVTHGRDRVMVPIPFDPNQLWVPSHAMMSPARLTTCEYEP